jgi:hypothetical protein
MNNYIVKIQSEEHFEAVKALLLEFNQTLEIKPQFEFIEDSMVYFNDPNDEWCVCGVEAINKYDIEITIEELRTFLNEQNKLNLL